MIRTVGEATLHLGDCRYILKSLPEQSVNTCVTSPPYFGLRDYGMDDQIGLEPTPDEFVAALVDVFREVRRVLRDDGTVWLNLGDSYARQAGNEESKLATLHTMGVGQKATHEAGAMRKGKNKPPPGLKAKDLIGIPWRVAFALQADGWYLRQDIIWHKPNPMPESVRDRCTKAHEYIFLLSKSPRYYYDADAIKEAACKPVGSNGNFGNKDAKARNVESLTGNMAPGVEYRTKPTRNKRSVWTITPKPFRGAHFATFPPDLVEPCILAGCPEGGVVLDPFGGAGTTALVANRHGRKSILCELNPEYLQIAADRLEGDIHQKRMFG